MESEWLRLAGLIASLLSAGAGVASSIFLAKGTMSLPAGQQSWSSRSPKELAFNAKAARFYRLGMMMLAAAFLLAAVAAICSFMA